MERSFATSLEMVTTDFPPFHFQNGNRVEGMVVEIVTETLALTPYQKHISIYPWARAHQLGRDNPNTLIFSLARTPEREKNFKWIGTVTPFHVHMWKLKKRTDIKVKNIEQSKQYVVGGVFDDVKSLYLKKMDFHQGKNLDLVRDDVLNAMKLYSGHIDMMPFDEQSFFELTKKAGLDVNLAEKMFEIPEISHDLYLAASLKTSDKIVADLKKALSQFKKTTHYQKIKDKYAR